MSSRAPSASRSPAAAQPPTASGDGGDPLSERRRSREVQRRLLRETRTVRLPLIGTVGIGLVSVALIIAQAVLLAKVIAAVFMDGAGFDEVAVELVVLAAISLARGLADAGFEAVGRIGAARVMGELRMRLARHALARPFDRSAAMRAPAGGDEKPGIGGDEKPGTGELVAAAIDGVDSLEAWFARYLPQVVLSVLAPLAILAWLIPRDWPAALILLVTAPLIPIFMILIGLATEHRARRRWRLLARLSSHFLDRVSGLETLRIHGLAAEQTDAIAEAGESYRRETMATLRIGFLSALVLELLAMLGTAVVAATVGIQLAGGHLELATGLCVLLLAPELYMPLRRLGTEFHAGADGIAAAERIFRALGGAGGGRDEARQASAEPAQAGRDHRAEPAPAPTGPLRPLAGAIVDLRGVDFAYPGREPVLRRLDLTIAAGERVAITGPSGCGKSTLIALILGLLQPQRGSLSVAGPAGFLDPTRAEDRARWHSRVAWVPQRPLIVSGSLADNVRLIAPEAGDAEVELAIRRAGLEPVVEELEFGPDTEIGEGGRRLSAGQRQRVALARAFLRDAPFVLLDEPTAHLDRETAAEIAAAIDELLRGRTALIASHRAEAIATADRILRLEGGAFVPRDDHAPAWHTPEALTEGAVAA